MTTATVTRPSWYTDEDDVLWERAKSAFRRDCKRSRSEADAADDMLNQHFLNNATESFRGYREDDEPAYRFGYAASLHFGSHWNEELESMLRSDWGDEAEWQRVRSAVQRAYRYGQNQLCETHLFYDVE